MASRLVGCPVFVDVLSWLSDEIDTADTRPYDPYQFLPGEKDELKALAAQWKGHTFGDFTKAQIDEESALMEELGVFTIGSREKDTGSNAPTTTTSSTAATAGTSTSARPRSPRRPRRTSRP